jgi:hypothetical protein
MRHVWSEVARPRSERFESSERDRESLRVRMGDLVERVRARENFAGGVDLQARNKRNDRKREKLWEWERA